MNFEESYAKLEAILEKMNSKDPSLEDSLKSYEEADLLLGNCMKKLQEAEQKIEVLIKNRAGELTLNSSARPETQEFGCK